MNEPKAISPAELASRFINHSHKNIFLTGKAGTGKTTFLKNIIQQTHKKAVIAAPTGIAAINAGGVTLHSLFQLPFGSFIPYNHHSVLSNEQLKITTPALLIKNMHMSGSKRNLLRELELLIIDEVSMLRSDLLDAIDVLLRYIKRQHHKAFGGTQILFIGDLLQLPPVVKENEWNILKNYYASPHFFDAKALQQLKPLYIELEKIYRQADPVFISLLNHFRDNEITDEDVTLINKYYKPFLKPAENENYITLTTHNYKADKLNRDFLQNIKSKSFFFEAKIDGEFNEYAYPVEKRLELKEGAQIMFVKNDPSGQQRFFNGKIGVVSFLSEEEIKVKFEDSIVPVTVEAYEWQNLKYTLNESSNEIEEKVIGSFFQYPIKLAWAITVHKSQGLTFDKALIDVGNAFAPGQIYVALSRLRSLDGLVLSSRINFQGIGQDEKVVEFAKTKKEQDDLNILIKTEEEAFLKSYLNNCFDFNELHKNISKHLQSYTLEEAGDEVKIHKDWALSVKKIFDEAKPHSDKFLIQINSILSTKENGYLDFLNSRIKSASGYFLPVFRKISTSVILHIKSLPHSRDLKSYMLDLAELEMAFYEQSKSIQKAVVLCDAILQQKEFTRQMISHVVNDASRADHINIILPTTFSKRKKKKEKRAQNVGVKSKEAEKPEKLPSREASLQLFSEGKTLEEIAGIRGFSTGTIEGHLAYYVSKGKLDAKLFVSEDRIKQVIEAAKSVDSFKFGPIKNILGDGFSYGEIKFAIAGYMAMEENNTIAPHEE
jgi:hypothetical protein